MATQTAIDEAKARAAIAAVKDRKRAPITPADLTRRSRAAALRRKLGKNPQPLWSGIDVA